MDDAKVGKQVSEPPTTQVGKAKASLPPYFQIQNYARLNYRLTLYTAFDEERGGPSRVWLEAFSNWPEQHWQHAQALQDLSHPNLLPVGGHWLTEDGQYYATTVEIPNAKFIPLRNLIAGSMDTGLVGKIIRQVALALDYCHSQGVLHLCLQPNFIWLGPDGSVRLEPFAARPECIEAPKLAGWAAVEEPTIRLKPYLSPELFKSETVADRRADVYSLGLVAYELLAGFNPFWSDSDVGTRLMIERKAIKPLHEINSKVSQELSRAIEKAISKNPARRFPTVLDFLAQFEAGLLTSTEEAASGWVETLQTNYQQIAQETFNFPYTRSTQSPVALPVPTQTPETVEPLESRISEPEIIAAEQPLAQSSPLMNTPPLAQPLTAEQPSKNPSRASGQIKIKARPRKGRPGWLRWAKIAPWLLVLNLVVMTGVLWAVYNSGPLPFTDSTPTVPESVPIGDPTLSAASSPTPVTVSATAGDSEAAGTSSPIDRPTRARYQSTLAEADRNVFELGNFDAAIKLYEAILARDNGYEPAYRELGKALFWRSHDTPTQTAVDTLKKAVALNPKDGLAWAYLALAYYDVYQYDKGLDAALQAYKIDPKLPEALAAQALLLTRTDDSGRANQTIAEAVGLDNSNLLVRWVEAALFRKDTNWSRARELLDELTTSYPHLALITGAKGDLLRNMGTANFPDAITFYNQAIKQDDQFAYAYTGLGYIYYAQGQYAQAEEAFKHALTLRPTHAHSLTGLGYLKLTQRNYSEALSAFKQATINDPREAEAYNGLAASYLDQGNYGQVGDSADLAIKYAPRYADPYYNKGRALYELKDYQGATGLFEQATKLAPSNPQYYEALAFANYKVGNNAAARQAAQESLRLKPDNPSLNELSKLLQDQN